jgi:hypothetical protein
MNPIARFFQWLAQCFGANAKPNEPTPIDPATALQIEEQRLSREADLLYGRIQATGNELAAVSEGTSPQHMIERLRDRYAALQGEYTAKCHQAQGVRAELARMGKYIQAGETIKLLKPLVSADEYIARQKALAVDTTLRNEDRAREADALAAADEMQGISTDSGLGEETFGLDPSPPSSEAKKTPVERPE